MESNMNRRGFLGTSAAGVASFAILRGGRAAAADKVRCVVIGCGGRGQSHVGAALGEQLVGLVDVSEKNIANTFKTIENHGKKKPPKKKGPDDATNIEDASQAIAIPKDVKVDTSKIRVFNDYRKLFESDLKYDAVLIATPNHHHALPAYLAMKAGKAVYSEKPLCHDIYEARLLAKTAAECKVPTMMGNQGHCGEGNHRFVELVRAGVVGKVTEVYSWCDRENGGFGPRPAAEPVPAGMHWDEWIGPAPLRDYHKDLHPHEWHGWYDFGNGGLGNMGCHILDGFFWALDVQEITSIVLEELTGGSDERYPNGCRLTWDIAANGDRPAFKAHWCDGFKQLPADVKAAANGKKPPRQRYRAKVLDDIKAKYPDETFDSNGTVIVGDKGMIMEGTYGGAMHVIPIEDKKKYEAIPRTLKRPKADPFANLFDAVKAGQVETHTPFSFGARLTEMCILGNLAQHAGVGNKVEWDAKNMKVTNLDALNRWVKCPRRPGWEM